MGQRCGQLAQLGEMLGAGQLFLRDGAFLLANRGGVVVLVRLQHDGRLQGDQPVQGLELGFGISGAGSAHHALDVLPEDFHGGEHLVLRQADADVRAADVDAALKVFEVVRTVEQVFEPTEEGPSLGLDLGLAPGEDLPGSGIAKQPLVKAVGQ